MRLERSRYWLTLISIPGLHGRRVIRAAEERLPGLYPGNIEEAVWDYRLLKTGKKAENDYLLVAVMAWDRSLKVPDNLYLPLFHGIDRNMPGRGQSLVISEAGTTDTLKRSESGDYTLISRPGANSASMLGDFRRKGGYRGAFRTNRAPRGAWMGLLAILLLLATAGLGLLDLRSRREELASLRQERRTIVREMEEAAARFPAEGLTPEDPAQAVPGLRPLNLLLTLRAGLPRGTEVYFFSLATGLEERAAEPGVSEGTDVVVLAELIGASALEAVAALAEEIEGSGLRLRLVDDVRPLGDGTGRERYRIEIRRRVVE